MPVDEPGRVHGGADGAPPVGHGGPVDNRTPVDWSEVARACGQPDACGLDSKLGVLVAPWRGDALAGTSVARK